eukprot:3741435-Rhodomonas_salina.2
MKNLDCAVRSLIKVWERGAGIFRECSGETNAVRMLETVKAYEGVVVDVSAAVSAFTHDVGCGGCGECLCGGTNLALAARELSCVALYKE